MTIVEICRRLGLATPKDPIDRDSQLFDLLAERTRQSDEELRNQYLNESKAASLTGEALSGKRQNKTPCR